MKHTPTYMWGVSDVGGLKYANNTNNSGTSCGSHLFSVHCTPIMAKNGVYSPFCLYPFFFMDAVNRTIRPPFTSCHEGDESSSCNHQPVLIPGSFAAYLFASQPQHVHRENGSDSVSKFPCLSCGNPRFVPLPGLNFCYPAALSRPKTCTHVRSPGQDSEFNCKWSIVQVSLQ